MSLASRQLTRETDGQHWSPLLRPGRRGRPDESRQQLHQRTVIAALAAGEAWSLIGTYRYVKDDDENLNGANDDATNNVVYLGVRYQGQGWRR